MEEQSSLQGLYLLDSRYRVSLACLLRFFAMSGVTPTIRQKKKKKRSAHPAPIESPRLLIRMFPPLQHLTGGLLNVCTTKLPVLCYTTLYTLCCIITRETRIPFSSSKTVFPISYAYALSVGRTTNILSLKKEKSLRRKYS